MHIAAIDNYTITNPAIANAIGDSRYKTSGSALQTFLQNFLELAFIVGGLIFFFMLIRNGFTYLTAGGDKEAVSKAQKGLTQALIGVVIIFGIYIIVQIVQTVFGINIINFSIPTLI